MSKKPKSCHGREIFSRMNFLYQASVLMAETNPQLACHYGTLCKSIGKKGVLRMEPNMKRTLCNCCGIVLQPGITADVEAVEGMDKSQAVKVNCKICRTTKNFVLNDSYKFWLDQDSSVIEKVTE